METLIENDPADAAAEPAPPARPQSRWRLGMLIGIAVTAVVGVAIVASNGDDDTQPSAEPAIELSLGDNALASCLAFDVATLSGMSPAFAATATAVDGEKATLTVDHWYSGGDAGNVVLHASAGMEGLIAGFNLEVGQQYLITAAEGNVNYCGYSGPATPELTAAFDQAFGG